MWWTLILNLIGCSPMSTCGEVLNWMWLADSTMRTCGWTVLLNMTGWLTHEYMWWNSLARPHGQHAHVKSVHLYYCHPYLTLNSSQLWVNSGGSSCKYDDYYIWQEKLTNVTSSEADNIWCMPPSILILADQVWRFGTLLPTSLLLICLIRKLLCHHPPPGCCGV